PTGQEVELAHRPDRDDEDRRRPPGAPRRLVLRHQVVGEPRDDGLVRGEDGERDGGPPTEVPGREPEDAGRLAVTVHGLACCTFRGDLANSGRLSARALPGTMRDASRPTRPLPLEEDTVTANQTDFNRLTWPEMNDAIERGKVVLLPTGSTEQHG